MEENKTIVRRIYADTNSSISFDAYDGEFSPLCSNVKTHCVHMQQTHKQKIITNQIAFSNVSYLKNINKNIIQKVAYVASSVVVPHEFFNKIITYVDTALADNDDYNVSKMKRLMGLEIPYRYNNPGRVIIFNCELMCYYDGRDWIKIHPLELTLG